MRILSRRRPESELDFAEFVREASPRLLRTAHLLGGAQDVAEDLVQDALERAYRHWRRIARIEQPEAYVRRIVVNLANDRWRRIGRSRESAHRELPDTPDPHDEYGRLDLRGQLTVMLGSLPIRMRTIIVLRYFHGMDDAEIADVLNLAPGTVRSQLSRGLARLREAVAYQDDAPPEADAATAARSRPHFAHASAASSIRPTVDLPHGGTK